MYWWIVTAVVAMFGLGAALGAPWLPTRRRETDTALDLLALEPGQTVIDLGSGTGDFLRGAAQRGVYGIGYEINPILCAWSLVRTWPWRKKVTIHCRNYWHVELPECDGVYVFLIKRYMPKLDRKLISELSPGTSVVSYAFPVPDREARTEQQGLYLYNY